MNRTRKYLIIILTILTALLCAAGASTWIISNPTSFEPHWAENKQTPVYIKRILEADYAESGINLTDISDKEKVSSHDLKFEFYDPTAKQVIDLTSSIKITYNLSASNGTDLKVEKNTVTVGSTYQISGVTINVLDDQYAIIGTYIDVSHLEDLNQKQVENDYIRLDGSYATFKELLFKYKTVDVGGTLYTIEDALAQDGNVTVKANTSFAGKGTSSIPDVVSLAGYSTGNGNYTVKSGVNLLLPMGKDNTDFPYDTGTMSKAYTEYFSAYAGIGLFSTLTVPSGIAVTVNGNLYINGARKNVDSGGTVSYTDKTYGYSQLEVNGSVNLESGARFVCYGFSYGTGAVTAKSGATVMEPLVLNGWKGGSISSCIFKHVFPINQFNLTNIEGKVVLNYGANYLVRASLEAGNQYFDQTINFLGTGEDCFVRLQQNAKLTKFIDTRETTEELTPEGKPKANETKGKVYLQSEGQMTFHNIGLTVSMLSISVDMSTAGLQVPIPANFVLEIKSGTATIPSGISVKLLPGAKCIVDAGATLQVQNGGSIYSYGQGGFVGRQGKYEGLLSPSYQNLGEVVTAWQDGNAGLKSNYPNLSDSYRGTKPTITVGDAKIDIKGVLNVESGATVGATIGGSENGQMNINGNLSGVIWEDYSGSISSADVIGQLLHINDGRNTLSTYFQSTIESYGENKSGIFKLAQGDYYYLNDAWRTKEVPTVTYHANGGIFASGSNLLDRSYDTLKDWQTKKIDLPYDLMSTAEKPTRPYYTFLGWATSPTATADKVIKEGGSTQIVVGGQNDLYAVWEATSYTIKYVMTDDEGNAVAAENYVIDIPEGFGAWNILRTDFVLSQVEVTSQIEDRFFFGWYNDAQRSTEILTLDASTIGNLTIEVDNSITLYGWIGESSIFDIQYVYERPTEFDNNADNSENYAAGRGEQTDHDVDTSKNAIVSADHINDALMKAEEKNDTDPNRQYYFLGWFDEAGNLVAPGAKINSSMNDASNDPAEGNRLIVLTAKWAKKAHVTISDKNFAETYSGYYKPGNQIYVAVEVGEILLSKWHEWDLNVEKDTYFDGGWETEASNKVQADGSFIIPEGDGAEILIQSVRVKKVTLTVHLEAKGEKGGSGFSASDGASAIASAKVTIDGEERPQITVTGPGGAGHFFGGDAAQLMSDDVYYYLKPGQTYTVTATSGAITSGTGNGTVVAGQPDITVTVSKLLS